MLQWFAAILVSVAAIPVAADTIYKVPALGQELKIASTASEDPNIDNLSQVLPVIYAVVEELERTLSPVRDDSVLATYNKFHSDSDLKVLSQWLAPLRECDWITQSDFRPLRSKNSTATTALRWDGEVLKIRRNQTLDLTLIVEGLLLDAVADILVEEKIKGYISIGDNYMSLQGAHNPKTLAIAPVDAVTEATGSLAAQDGQNAALFVFPVGTQSSATHWQGVKQVTLRASSATLASCLAHTLNSVGPDAIARWQVPDPQFTWRISR